MQSFKSLTNANTRGIIEISVIVVVAVVVAIIVRTFLLQLFYIPSASMDPYLKVKDKVFVNKLSYSFHDIERGDVVVFEAPESVRKSSEAQQAVNSSIPVINDLIKRVVSLPGESVQGRCKNNENICVIDIYIDGKKLNEPYLEPDILYATFGPVEIPAGSYFMMGDNRDGSDDGRVFGPIPKDDIVGRAFFRLWPMSEFGFLG